MLPAPQAYTFSKQEVYVSVKNASTLTVQLTLTSSIHQSPRNNKPNTELLRVKDKMRLILGRQTPLIQSVVRI